MVYFCCQLRPPRSTFPGDMMPAEGQAMAAHADYLRELMSEGPVLLAGPVMEPSGAWGLCVASGPDAAAVSALLAADPVVTTGLGFHYDVHPMLSLMLPEGRPAAGNS
jgi:uncharacterized protein YciI